MNDEEYGRAWAAQQGVKVAHWPDRDCFYLTLDGKARQLILPLLGREYFDTEPAAYRLLGMAVRSVHRAVPQLTGEAA